jgi:hypothetical protein
MANDEHDPYGAFSADLDGEGEGEAGLLQAWQAGARAALRPPAGAPASYETLQRRYQVDLDDERNLADLEDAGLRQHMLRARQQLACDERALSAVPAVEALVDSDTQGRRGLSALTVALKAQKTALQCAGDAVASLATAASGLVRGERPHGFPAAGAALAAGSAEAQNLAYLAGRLTAAVTELGQVATALGNLERDLSLSRRHSETATEGLRRRLDHYEKGYQALAALVDGGRPAPGRV